MWPVYASIAMLCFAGMQLLFRHLTRDGLTPAIVLFFVFGFGWLLYLVHFAVFRPAVAVNAPRLGLLLAAGVLAYVGNLYAVRAVSIAPNPGYANALIGLQALLVTCVSVFLLGATLSWLKLVGVMLCVAGAALLVL